MDEVFLTIGGERHYLWRAVDQDGNVLDILVQSRRNKKAAKRFFRKLLKGLQYVPRVIITDKLKSYAAARREILPGVEHRQHKRLNNRAENSHQPTRLREKKMRKFKSAKQAQRFLSADRAHLWAFSTTTTFVERRGIPCYFTRPLPELE
jgi:putative transposase